jgi:hypothetical protein
MTLNEHWNDADGNPAGGISQGVGFTISWQNGPLGRGEDRREPNGAFVEEVLKAVVGRLEFYEDSKFSCSKNADAIEFIEDALVALKVRTEAREVREVEGTHTT